MPEWKRLDDLLGLAVQLERQRAAAALRQAGGHVAELHAAAAGQAEAHAAGLRAMGARPHAAVHQALELTSRSAFTAAVSAGTTSFLLEVVEPPGGRGGRGGDRAGGLARRGVGAVVVVVVVVVPEPPGTTEVASESCGVPCSLLPMKSPVTRARMVWPPSRAGWRVVLRRGAGDVGAVPAGRVAAAPLVGELVRHPVEPGAGDGREHAAHLGAPAHHRAHGLAGRHFCALLRPA